MITGGEPLEHDLEALCAALAAAVPSLPLHLETSGAAPLALSGRFAWITLSPKRHRPPSLELLARCDERKVVVHEAEDLAFAAAMARAAMAARPLGTPRRPCCCSPSTASLEAQDVATSDPASWLTGSLGLCPAGSG